MIRSVEISNFRGIQNGKLEDFTPLTILVGPNGCGKSTVLDALLLGAHPVPQEALEYVYERRQVVEKADWLFWRGQVLDFIQVDLKSNNASRRLHLYHLRSEDGVYGSIQEDTEVKGENISVARVSSNNPQSGIYSLQPLNDVKNIRIVEYEVRNKQTPAHTLFTDAIKAGRRDEARSLLNDVVPGLDHIEILTEQDKPTIWLVYKDYAVPASLGGDGIQSLLRLSLELVSCSDGVVLLEEPEVHQHPRAIWQTAKVIWAAIRRGIQIIVSTHSLELIDALLAVRQEENDLEKMSLFSLKLDEGCLKVGRLDGEDIAIMRTQIESDLR